MKFKLTSLTIALIFLISPVFSLTACKDKSSKPINDQEISSTSSNQETQSSSKPSCSHNWKNATCINAKTCLSCGTITGSPLGHNLIQHSSKSPTCTSIGWNAYESCTRCDYTTIHNITNFSAEEIYANAKDCAVEIITFDIYGESLSLGSGFVYSSDGKIVTNYHVIEEACSADVYIGDTPYNVVSVLTYDINRDIAILKINATNLKTLNVCTNPVQTGSTIYALGSSRGLTSTFSRGIITSANREIDGVTYIQHDAAISSGNSGGPLLNEYCEIIGINTLTLRDSQNLNFAIFTTELNNLTYENAMTLEDVYLKECDSFAKVKNYVMQQGSLNSDGDEYIKILNTSYSDDGSEIIRSIFYNPSTDIITIAILWDNDYFLTIELSEIYYAYDYTLYWSSQDFYMMGSLPSNTFSSSTTYLSYTYTNVYSSLTYSFSKVGASLAKVLIIGLNTDLKEIGVTAFDLDFLNF